MWVDELGLSVWSEEVGGLSPEALAALPTTHEVTCPSLVRAINVVPSGGH